MLIFTSSCSPQKNLFYRNGLNAEQGDKLILIDDLKTVLPVIKQNYRLNDFLLNFMHNQ